MMDLQLLYPDNVVSTKPIIEIRSRSPSLDDRSVTGHTYVAVGREVDNGLTIFHTAGGFYPKGGKLKAFKATVMGGPGSVTFKMEDVSGEASYRAYITPHQERLVKHILTNWDEREYKLAASNCVDMMRNVSEAIGLKGPKIVFKKGRFFQSVGDVLQDMTPTGFVENLNQNNAADAPVKAAKKDAQRSKAARAADMRELREIDRRYEERLKRAREAPPADRTDDDPARPEDPFIGTITSEAP